MPAEHINTGWSQDTSFLRLAGLPKLGSAQRVKAWAIRAGSFPCHQCCWDAKDSWRHFWPAGKPLSERPDSNYFRLFRPDGSLRSYLTALGNRRAETGQRDSGAQLPWQGHAGETLISSSNFTLKTHMPLAFPFSLTFSNIKNVKIIFAHKPYSSNEFSDMQAIVCQIHHEPFWQEKSNPAVKSHELVVALSHTLLTC